MKHLYRAPDFSDNEAVERTFGYVAEIDMLGWKFRKLPDGRIWIDTPFATESAVGRNMLIILSQAQTELLAQLIDTEAPDGTGETPHDWDAVGSVA